MTATAPAVAGVVQRPALFDLLDRGVLGPVTLVCAPAGSGKTMLIRSWLESRGPPMPVARLSVASDEGDATRFWGAVTDALRRSGAVASDDPLATLAAAPMGGQREFVAGLTEGLGRLASPVLLILDDLEQLRSEEALESLGHLLGQAPAQLRCLLISRSEPRVGLHRLRLTGDLTELRPGELILTLEEAGELLRASGVELSASQVQRLHERTEGWAAGLRLAALSLARHPDPAQFVEEFSGSEWAIAEYLGAEVFARQSPEVRDLLLRTSILERVSGPLADHLTGRADGARILHRLDEVNALVMAVDVARSWFRYHRLLVDLLRRELEREAAAEIPELHRRAAGWLAGNGEPIEAIRHAQQAGDWELAAELLGRHWVGLLLDGEETTLAALLAALPPELVRGNAELCAIAAADHLAASRWEEADALLDAAEASPRTARAETALATVQLIRARQLGDVAAVAEGAAAALARDDPDAGGPELRALAHANLGLVYGWTLRLDDAQEHVTKALRLGRRIGSPFVETLSLNGAGLVAVLRHRLGEADDLYRQGLAIAERVGWTSHPNVGVTYLFLAQVAADRGRFGEADEWVARADPILAHAAEPAAVEALRFTKGTQAFARGRYDEALAWFREGERLADPLRAPFFITRALRQWQLRAQLRLGDLDAMRAALEQADGGPEWPNLEALLRLAEGDPEAAATAVAPALRTDWPQFLANLRIEAQLLDGIAQLRLGDVATARQRVERALDISSGESRVWIYVTVPGARELLESQPMHETAHPGHLRDLLDQLAGAEPAAMPAASLGEPLTDRELAVLRFLPTNLSAPEIASELILSVHTVKTHMRKLYAKLDVHTRAEAVQAGRALGLLATARRR